MARARNIKPAFFQNEDLIELDFATRLLFIGLWTVADREGRLADRPKRIKMQVFPADNVDVDTALDELDHSGFIERYVVHGERYIQIINFGRHQNPHGKEANTEIPDCRGELSMPSRDKSGPATNQHEASTRPAPGQQGAGPADSLNSDSLNSDSGILIPDCERGADKPPELAARSGPARPHRLPEDWQPTDELIQVVIAKHGLSRATVDAEIEKFHEHYGGNGKPMLRWDLAWQKWMRSVPAVGPRSFGPPGRAAPRTVHDRNEAMFAEAFADLRGHSPPSTKRHDDVIETTGWIPDDQQQHHKRAG